MLYLINSIGRTSVLLEKVVNKNSYIHVHVCIITFFAIQVFVFQHEGIFDQFLEVERIDKTMVRNQNLNRLS